MESNKQTYKDYEEQIKHKEQKEAKQLTKTQQEANENFSVAVSSNPGTQAMFKFLNNGNIQVGISTTAKGKPVLKGTMTEETRQARIEITHVDYSKVLEKEEAQEILDQLKQEEQDLYKRNKNSLFDLKFLALLEQYALFNASQDNFNENTNTAIILTDTDLADKFNMITRNIQESLNGVTRNWYRYTKKEMIEKGIKKNEITNTKHYIGTIENLNDIRLNVKFKTRRKFYMDTPGGLQPYTITRIKDKVNKKVGLLITINPQYLMYERLYLKQDKDNYGAYERLPYFIWTIDNSIDFMIIKYCYDLLREDKKKTRPVKVKTFLENIGIIDDTGRNTKTRLYEPLTRHINKINTEYKDFINIDYEQKEFEAINGTIDFDEWQNTNLIITYKKIPLYNTIETNKRKLLDTGKTEKKK